MEALSQNRDDSPGDCSNFGNNLNQLSWDKYWVSFAGAASQYCQGLPEEIRICNTKTVPPRYLLKRVRVNSIWAPESHAAAYRAFLLLHNTHRVPNNRTKAATTPTRPNCNAVPSCSYDLRLRADVPRLWHIHAPGPHIFRCGAGVPIHVRPRGPGQLARRHRHGYLLHACGLSGEQDILHPDGPYAPADYRRLLESGVEAPFCLGGFRCIVDSGCACTRSADCRWEGKGVLRVWRPMVHVSIEI